MSWPSVSLDSVAILDRDSVHPKDAAAETPYIGLEHVDGDGRIDTAETISTAELKSNKFRFSDEHVLFGKLRPYLRKIARPDFSGVCSTDIIPLLPSDQLDRDFLFHYLRTPAMVGFATSRCSGANLPRLSPKQLAGFQIPLPPLAEQKRIAGILDAADALRAKRRESIDQLDRLIQATFLEMFGDPVTNPKGWERVELHALVQSDDKINYGVVQPGNNYADGIPLVRVGDIASGNLLFDEIKYIDPKIESKYKRSRLKGTELLISCVGSIGIVCKVSEQAKGFNIARAVARVPLAEGVDRDFVLHCLRSSGVQQHFQKETRTVSQPTLNIGLIKTAPVIQPPLGDQRHFAAIVRLIEANRETSIQHSDELDALFASLQSLAFRGEL